MSGLVAFLDRVAEAWLPFAGDLTLKASLLLLAAGAASFAQRRASASARHLSWTLAVAAVVVLPLAGLVAPRWTVDGWPVLATEDVGRAAPVARPGAVTRREVAAPPIRATEPPGTPGEAGPAAATTASRVSPAARVPSSAAFLLLLWIAGASALGLRAIVGALRLRRLVGDGRRLSDGPWRDLADSAADTLGVGRRRFRVYAAARPTSPLAWGAFRVAIVLPPSFGAWSPERQRHVLLHELAHVKRLDCATQWLASVAVALHWFNPLVWLASRRMLAERERACDDQVLLAGTRASAYADDLLQIARAEGTVSPAVVSVAMARRSQIAGRLLAVLDPALRRSGVRPRTLAIAAGLGVALVAPLAALTAAQDEAVDHVVVGRVVDSEGAPVEGARVTLRTSLGTTASAETDTQGRFRAAAGEAGPYRLRVRHPDFAFLEREAFQPGPELTEVSLQPGLAIEGRVLDASRGDAVAGVRVRADASGTGWDGDRESWEARSDEAGRFRIGGLGPGMHTVTATAPGFGRVTRPAPAGTALDLVLFAGSTIEGVVVDVDGRPVSGVEVRALEGPISNVAIVLDATAPTDADGAFEIAGAEAARYRLEVRGEGYAPLLTDPVEVEGEIPARVELTLERGAVVTGTLVAPDGAPVAGQVEVRESSGYPLPQPRVDASRVEAGPDGAFRVGPLASGDHVLVVGAPDRPSTPLELRVPPGEPEVDVGEVRLEAGLGILGKVVDPDGRPISGAVISGYAAPGSRGLVRSEADGSFEITGLAEGYYHLQVSAPGFVRPEPIGPRIAAGATGVVLEMLPAGAVVGRVEDAEGRAVTAFAVQLESEARSSGRTFYGSARPFGDAEGRFRLDPIGEGTHVLEVTASGFARGIVTDVVVTPGETTDVGTLRLDRGAALSGTVVDETGFPVAGAELRLHTASRDSFWARKETVSGVDGAYRLEGLEPGTVAMAARHRDYAEERIEGLEIPAGRVELTRDVVLLRGGSIEGVVHRRDGRPVVDAPVTLMVGSLGALASPSIIDNLISTGADGRFRFRSVRPGPVQVHLFSRSGQMLMGVAVEEVEVQAGATARVEFALSEIVVRGQVTRGGAPAPEVMVRARSPRTDVLRVMTGPGGAMPPNGPRRLVGTTDASGRYELLLDGPGTHEVALLPASGGGQFVTRSVDVPDVPAYVLDLELPRAVIAGTVVDAATGAPVADARVEVSPEELAPPAFAVSDVAGRFEIFVEPGPRRVVVSLDGYAPAETEVRARAGAPGADLEIALARGLQLRGRVVDAAGNGIGGLGVAAFGDAPKRVASRARTLGDGSFILAGLEERSYAIATGAPAAGFGIHPGARPDPEANLVLTLRPAAGVRVVVVDSEGAGVEGVNVSLDRVDGRWLAQGRGWVDRTGPDGAAELSVPGGWLEIRASHPDGREGSVTVDVASGAEADAEVVLGTTEG